MALSANAIDRPVAGSNQQAPLSALCELILMRVAVQGGATRAELARDLRAMTHPDLAPAAWRIRADADVGELVRSGLASEARAKVRATPAGVDRVAALLAVSPGAKTTWADLRDGALTATALGLNSCDPKVMKALASPDNLRALIVQRAYGLGDGRAMSLAKLRAQLAVRALERAFGNQIKSGLGSGSGLAAKASRLLAGQLSKQPRDYGSDGRLIAALAAEHLDASNSEAETLRAALLRRWFAGRAEADEAPGAAGRRPAAAPVAQLTSPRPVTAMTAVANDRGDAAIRPLPAARPDLPGFIKAVQKAASARAEGWPGNRKAFICHVWQEIKSSHPAWALSEIEFKGMLAEAHRTGGLVLANADLKDKKHIQEFELSAIQYKNTVWHFVRVEEA